MRLGVIDRVETSGERVQVFVRVDGDIEGPAPVAVVLGARQEITTGSPCALFSLETALGEIVAVPMEWARDSAARGLVALFSDVQSLKADLVAHGHISSTAGTPTGPAVGISPPNDPINPTITGSDRFKVTHG